MADANQLARAAVERLSEDEALRGDLSDIGFGPLLDWAVAAVQAYAAKAADSAAMDRYTDRIRGVVQAVVEAAQAGKLADPAPLLDFDPANPATATAALTDLSLGDDPDDNAVQITAVLQAALVQAPPAASPVTSTAPESAPSEKPAEPVTEVSPAPEANTGAIKAALEAASRAANAALEAATKAASPAPPVEAEATKITSMAAAEPTDTPKTPQAANPAPVATEVVNPDQAAASQPQPEPETPPKPVVPQPGPPAPEPLKSKVNQAYKWARGEKKRRRKRKKG